MNVPTPEEGLSVSGTFTATVLGSSFEATLLWEIRDGLADRYAALPAFAGPEPHAASTELLAHRAALLRAQRDNDELRRRLRSRRELLRALTGRSAPPRPS